MKVYLVWYIDKKKGSSILLDIYEDSEKALKRVQEVKKQIIEKCQTFGFAVTMETRYVLL